MNILELVPPKQLSFSVPRDCERSLTLTNLTLHSVFVVLLPSHPFELALSASHFHLQAFQEKQVKVVLNWSQEGLHLSSAKLRLLYREVEEEEQSQEKLLASITSPNFTIHSHDLDVAVDLDQKSSDFLPYPHQIPSMPPQSSETSHSKKHYLIKRVSHLWQSREQQASMDQDPGLKDELLNYLQGLPGLISIHPCPNNSFLAQIESPSELCQMPTFTAKSQVYTYALSTIVPYGIICCPPSLLVLDQPPRAQEERRAEVPETRKELIPAQQGEEEKRGERTLKKGLLKQTFVSKRTPEMGRLGRRRNKSEEKVIERDDEEEDEEQEQSELFRQQMLDLKRLQNSSQKREDVGAEFRETTIEFTQKILNLFMEEKEGITEVYVVLRDCVRCMVLGNPSAHRIIKFDAIYEENVHMPCPVDKYKDEIIFGNETILYWVDVASGESEWKYVQRKYIYALAVIHELSLVAVGGKNFSKLAYFGKETTRTNIKMYSCSSGDKHEHLFTYDIPGHQVGNVVNMAYITTPPHSTKLLLVQTLNPSSQSSFHFLRVKAFNKVEVYAQIDLSELGILNLIRFRHNSQTGKVVCQEALGQTGMDSFKRLKLKCQYEKVEVSTEGLKFPLKKYLSFQVGGGQAKTGEWMCLIDQNYLVHVFDFGKNTMRTHELMRSDIRQAFSLDDGKQLMLCTEGTIFIRKCQQ